MRRRTLLAGSLGALAAPSMIEAETSRILRFIPQADLAALDPVWTSVYVTRNHGYMVFDTLYGQDSAFRTQPQMVEDATTGRDGATAAAALRRGEADW